MSAIFTFPVRGLKRTSHVTLICYATSVSHEDDFLDEVRRYCDENSPPDDVALLGPSFIKADLQRIRESDRFLKRLPGASRYVDTPVASQICFGADGLQNCEHPDIARIVRAGLTCLFDRHQGLIRGSSAFHFIKPSGRHCDAFLRTANVLVRGVEIEFIAACCLASCPDEMTRIYTDTGAIHSVAFAMLRLFTGFGDSRSKSIIDSFGSYQSFDNYPFIDAAHALVLVSASTSGKLIEGIVRREPQIEHALTIFFLGESSEAQSILCDLTFHATDNPDGLSKINSYAADSCPMCLGSTGVRMSHEQFMPQGPQVEPVLIRAKDAPPNTSKFFEPLVGHEIFKANYREADSSSASREVYLDLVPLFSTDLFSHVAGLKDDFDRFVSHLVSVNTRRIVHLNDKASKHFAGRIAIFAHEHGVTADILSAKELQELGGEDPQLGGTTIVAASAISTGRGLSEVSKSLRYAQRGGAIKYAIAFCRTKDQVLSQDVQRHLRFGDHGPREHDVSIMYEFYLPSWRPEGQTAWEAELKLLSSSLEPPPSDLQRRKEIVRESLSSTNRGLANDLFLSSPAGDPLKLRPSFAFWDFDYSSEDWADRPPSQADAYATIVTVLHNIRQGKRNRENSLNQDDHVRRVISPRCFERFNDGIIQASLLRAAYFSELDYSLDDSLSEDMRSILSTVFGQSGTSVGEGAYEFLLAIALGKLKLGESHTASLVSDFNGTLTGPVPEYLWEKIRERYSIDDC
ncbi:hypothetical protein Q31b_33800 [Novipirellula aureliae]|uniref:Uncharacterized protein n=1 Tax=Novipirellula aureliae TaxID=2527966 RepID=A0A5C6DYB4_9BACT|nr:hypothetical protein [Novipirellula aureliae]TWU40036.1 hypothetical protein Q31b_33800 [Novipirellula aureliae]